MAADSNSPATKGDLAQLHVEMRTEMSSVEERLTERLRDVETHLLSAFYSFAASNQKRVGEVEHDAAGIKDRLAILEFRLTEVEKRLNMPPAA
jgi:hypothetical protein